jgi:hypothetical protein
MNKLHRLQKALKLVFPNPLTPVASLYNNKINEIPLAPFTSVSLQSPCHFSLEVTSYLGATSKSNDVRTRGLEFAVLDPKGIL